MEHASRRVEALLRHVQSPADDSSSSAESPSSSLRAAPAGSFASDLWAVATAPLVETERDGGWLVAKVLSSHGVRFVFTLSGGHISPVLVGAKASGIRIVDVRHEVNAVFAADAVARLTGVPGVAAVTAGPGCTNTITAVKNAAMAQSPIVLIGGAAATLTRGRGALQDIDQISLFAPICKWTASVATARDIVPAMREAFRQAMSGVPGPVFVELPLDVIYPLGEARGGMGLTVRERAGRLLSRVEAAAASADANVAAGAAEELGRLQLPEEAAGQSALEWLRVKPAESSVFLTPPEGAKGVPPWIAQVYMRFKLRHLFAGAWELDASPGSADFAPLPVDIPQPAGADVSAVAALLAKAERPVIVVGSQATLLAPRADELRAALESLGAPVFLGGMARGLLGRNCAVHVRQNRGAALKRADVIVLLGAITDFRMDYGRSLGRRAQIVAVNRSAADLKLNSPLFWSAAVSAQADPCLFALALTAKIGSRRLALASRLAPWTAELKAAEVAKEAANAAKTRAPAFGRKGADHRLVNPLELVHELEEHLPDDSVIVADGGDFVATTSYVVRPRGPLRWLDPGAFGTLGVGGGFALGAKLVRPTAEVWLIWGDGSAGYSIAEIDTMTRHNAPCIALIGNDAGWTQIEREQVPMFQSDVACVLDYLPYDTVARGYGGAGVKLLHPPKEAGADGDDDESTARRLGAMASVINEAQRLNKEGKAVVINCEIGKTDFREGSISV